MKELSFDKMERIEGGRCGRQALVLYASGIGTVASIGVPLLVFLGAGLTASAYYDYVKCLQESIR